MTLEELKNILVKAKFSPEATKLIEKIMTAAIAAGGITKEQKVRLLGIVDLEIKRSDLEANFLEEATAALQEYVGELGKMASRSSSR